MKFITEDQLQVDENGNVQTDGSEKDGQAAGEDDKDKKTYEATATVEDSEDQICDFGTVKSVLRMWKHSMCRLRTPEMRT